MLGLNHYRDNSPASWEPLKAREMCKSLSYREEKLGVQNLDQKVVKLAFSEDIIYIQTQSTTVLH